MGIPKEYTIYDTRSSKDFKTQSYSGYLIKDITGALTKSFTLNKIENACNWSIELLLSGHIDKFWDKVLSISFKNININNPKLPKILYKRYQIYIKLLEKNDNNSLLLRNNQKIRNMLCELCYIVTFSLKTKALTFKKITQQDFDMVSLSSKLTATSDSYISDKFKFGDPDETKIILNEFNYCLISKKYELAVYWLSWIFEWEKKNTKKDKMYSCGYREISNVDRKYFNDIVWFIWEIILKETNKLSSEETILNIQSIFKLYKYNFKTSSKGKRSIYFLWAIKYFTDVYSLKQDVYPNYYLYIRAVSNINFLYFDKNKFSVNTKQKKIDKTNYNENINYIKSDIEKKNNKIKAKQLKMIADEKMKYKISKVEEIDSLLLNKNELTN